jgi:MerR family transcriptional regulator, copper efflux regulator
MRISELADKTGLTIDTLRFYEKQGLLHEMHFTRRANGYRDYNEAAVARLLLIRQGHAAGITLTEMGQALDEWEAGSIHPADKVAFFDKKLAQVEARLAELERIRAYLQHKRGLAIAELAEQAAVDVS